MREKFINHKGWPMEGPDGEEILIVDKLDSSDPRDTIFVGADGTHYVQRLVSGTRRLTVTEKFVPKPTDDPTSPSNRPPAPEAVVEEFEDSEDEDDLLDIEDDE